MMSDDWIWDSVRSGPLVVAAVVSAAAGLVSFFSPCVAPLLPGYLSYVSGLSASEVIDRAGGNRRRVVLGSTLFVAGFSTVFVLFGVAAGSMSQVVSPTSVAVRITLGVLLLILGAGFLGALPVPRGFPLVHRAPQAGLGAAPVLGVLFGLGWTPCMGPTLAAIVTLAYNQDTVGRGAILLTAYSVGLGLPFLAGSVALSKTLRVARVVQRHRAWLSAIGGTLLIVIGMLVLADAWDPLMAWIQGELVEYYVPSL